MGVRLGRYELLCLLAEGGMAQVWLARLHGVEGFERRVVLKRLYGWLEKRSLELGKFIEEAKLVAQLHHPNIVEVLELFQAEGSYFITMEYVAGVDAAGLLRGMAQEGVKLPLAVACTIVSDVLRGLHHAHEAVDATGMPLGIVHRDLSPHNVLLSRHGTVKVTDFGIAKVSRGGQSITGDLRGKFAYMAPEQARGERSVDRRADIFVAGLVLHELITGLRVYRSDQDTETLEMARVANVPPLLDVPGPVREVLQRALMPDKEARFATALEMQHALAQALTVVPDTSTAHDELARFVQHWAAEPIVVTTPEGTADVSRERTPLLQRQLNPPQSATPFIGVPLVTTATPSQLALLNGDAVGYATAENTADAPVVRPPARLSRRAIAGAVVFAGAAAAGVAALSYSRTTTPVAASTPPQPSLEPSPAIVTDTPRPSLAPAEPTGPKPARAAGYLNINATLWSYVWLDGHKLPGTTPVKGLRVAPGKHKIRVENPPTDKSEEFIVDIIADKTVTKVVRYK